MRPRNVDAIDATFVALLPSGFAHESRRSDEQIAVEGSQMNGAGRSIAKTPGDHSNRSGAMFARRFSEREWFGFERLQSTFHHACASDSRRLRISITCVSLTSGFLHAWMASWAEQYFEMLVHLRNGAIERFDRSVRPRDHDAAFHHGEHVGRQRFQIRSCGKARPKLIHTFAHSA